MIDVSTGLTGGAGVLAALYHRKRTGEGQFLEVPLFDTGFYQTAMHAVGYILDGTVLERLGNGDYFMTPVGRYSCLDGEIALAVETDAQFEGLCQALGMEARGTWVGNPARVADREALDAAVAAALAVMERTEALVSLQAAGVPCHEARDIPAAFADPAAAALLGPVPHADIGETPNMPSPMHLAGTPARAPQGAPLLGHHGETVLGEWLGYSAEQVRAVRSAGAMGKMV